MQLPAILRGAPAGISLREPAAWLSQHLQYTPLIAASHLLLLPKTTFFIHPHCTFLHNMI